MTSIGHKAKSVFATLGRFIPPFARFDLEADFRYAAGRWRGGDGAVSVALSNNNQLWLFGDSWIAATPGEPRQSARMIANSLALENRGTGVWRFYWQDNEPEPAPPILPKFGSRVWPLSAEIVRGSLVVFLQGVQHNEACAFNVWRVSNLMAIVDDPGAPLEEWSWRFHDIPFFRATKNGDRMYGAEVVQSNKWVYVFGFDEDWTSKEPITRLAGRRTVLARAPLADILKANFQAWHFAAKDRWSPDPDSATPLFAGAAPVMSISLLSSGKWAAIYTQNGLSREVTVRIAPALEGPWGPPRCLMRCWRPWFHRRYYCYAARVHKPAPRAPGRLALTYSVNSFRGIADQVADPRLYWPRFANVPEPF